MRRIEQGFHRLVVCVAVAAALGVYGCGGDGGDNETVTTATLITLDAPAGSLVAAGTAPDGVARYDLVLNGVSELAVAFAARSVRVASLVPVNELVANWGRSGFAAAPPSALLTVRDQQGGTWIVSTAFAPLVCSQDVGSHAIPHGLAQEAKQTRRNRIAGRPRSRV